MHLFTMLEWLFDLSRNGIISNDSKGHKPTCNAKNLVFRFWVLCRICTTWSHISGLFCSSLKIWSAAVLCITIIQHEKAYQEISFFIGKKLVVFYPKLQKNKLLCGNYQIREWFQTLFFIEIIQSLQSHIPHFYSMQTLVLENGSSKL